MVCLDLDYYIFRHPIAGIVVNPSNFSYILNFNILQIYNWIQCWVTEFDKCLRHLRYLLRIKWITVSADGCKHRHTIQKLGKCGNMSLPTDFSFCIWNRNKSTFRNLFLIRLKWNGRFIRWAFLQVCSKGLTFCHISCRFCLTYNSMGDPVHLTFEVDFMAYISIERVQSVKCYLQNDHYWQSLDM